MRLQINTNRTISQVQENESIETIKVQLRLESDKNKIHLTFSATTRITLEKRCFQFN